MGWNLIGHAWAVDLLQRHIQRDQVRHAYLFVGPDGVGKKDLALGFAQALNCVQSKRSGQTCTDTPDSDPCRACTYIPEMKYPDLHLVEPEEAGAQIKVEQVRELQSRLFLAPYEGKYRIALLDQFHQANPNASNALLKVLEEPPSQVVLLLTATSSEVLLPTIVSRCETLPLRGILQEELEATLTERGYSTAVVELASRLSFGMPGIALEYADHPELLEQRQQRLEELMRMMSENLAERFRFAAQQSRGRDYRKQQQRLIDILKTWLSFLRDALLLALQVDFRVRNPDWMETLEGMAGALGSDRLFSAVQATERTLNAIDQNANLQLSLENLMLDLPQLPFQSG